MATTALAHSSREERGQEDGFAICHATRASDWALGIECVSPAQQMNDMQPQAHGTLAPSSAAEERAFHRRNLSAANAGGYAGGALLGEASLLDRSSLSAINGRLYRRMPRESSYNLSREPLGGAALASRAQYSQSVLGHSYPPWPGSAPPLALMGTQYPGQYLPTPMEARQPVFATQSQMFAGEIRPGTGLGDPMTLAASPPSTFVETRQPVLAAAAQLMARRNRQGQSNSIALPPSLGRGYLKCYEEMPLIQAQHHQICVSGHTSRMPFVADSSYPEETAPSPTIDSSTPNTTNLETLCDAASTAMVGSPDQLSAKNETADTPAHEDQEGAGNTNNPRRLAIPTDAQFLDPVHIFLRTHCLEIFEASREDTRLPGRGARATTVGQVGLRCAFCRLEPKEKLTRQAVCYPSKRETIFESVRNYRRTHIESCPCISQEMKTKYRSLNAQVQHDSIAHKYVKAYYAESAWELGIVDSAHGLKFGGQRNESDTPSDHLQALIKATENPGKYASFWAAYFNTNTANVMKFEAIASERTREVLILARSQPTLLVRPEDFPTVSDYDFVLFSQLVPFVPSEHAVHITHERKRFGFSCKFCARAGDWINGTFPVDLNVPGDTSLCQRMLVHFMRCQFVPQDVKNTFTELKELASLHGSTPKRGSRKKFLEKVWRRLRTIETAQQMPSFVFGLAPFQPIG